MGREKITQSGNGILFHSTDKFENLKSIIKNGFYPSYAKETFANREQRVLMVSLSYIPLREINGQTDYGNYAIGFDVEWGENNKFHPVIYTFKNSEFENAVIDLIEIATSNATLKSMFSVKEKGQEIKAKGFFLEKMQKLIEAGINQKQIEILEDVANYTFSAGHLLNLYSKQSKVVLENGTNHIAFFDREWRYIPKNSGGPVLLFKESFGVESPEYNRWDKNHKPHRTDIPLVFKITDIKYLVVTTKKEADLMLDFLEKQFGKEQITKLIQAKSLQIVSKEKSVFEAIITKICSFFSDAVLSTTHTRPHQ